ncbi:MAG: V-type ATPase 116kDa subunit family protein [Anaerolineales bacterium]|jgi:V/A-type H+-transporting ATPase subunit I
MNVEMLPIEIVGLKKNLQTAIQVLRQLGCVHIDEITESMNISARPLTLDRETLSHQEELSYFVARIEGLLEALSVHEAEQFTPSKKGCLAEVRNGVETLTPKVQSLSDRREKLQAELAALPRYEATLRKLLPISPPSAREPGRVTIGILVSRAHVGILDSVGKSVLDLTAGRAEVVASDVDTSTRAMLLVFPEEFTAEVEVLLGREDVSRLRLPAELGEGPPDMVLAVLHRRMVDIPIEIQTIDRELRGLAALWGSQLMAWRNTLRDQLEANSVLSFFGETDMTFVLVGWVPAEDFDRLTKALTEILGETILVRQLPLSPEIKKQAPVALQNPRPAKPFESLVNLLALPRYGHIDPTLLMALFLPIFYGMILGDVGYGLLLLAFSLVLLRKFRSGVAHDLVFVLVLGSAWSILFGILYGEAFGNLGEHLGMRALWFDRASSEHVAGLLIMTLAVGAVHITLGLILGVWEAFKDRSRNHLLERGGMLLGLISLFLLVGVLAGVLPAELRTPAWVGIIIGIVLLGASLGWLGILMGPIEFIGLIGNVLSYLRIAAIGLASVYLAKVANDVAGIAGNILLGIIIALLIHALNLVLGAFSPTIHSLRLHYVEFFRKFYEGGGRLYKPFRSSLSSSLSPLYDTEEG